MQRQRILLLLAGWLLGVAMTLGVLTFSGGWYEYQMISSPMLTKIMKGNPEAWEPIPGIVGANGVPIWYRRPKVRLWGP